VDLGHQRKHCGWEKHSNQRRCVNIEISWNYRFALTEMSGFVVFVLILSLSAMVPCLGSPYPSVAVAPQPCLAPLQWEGRTVQYDHATGRNTRAAVSYDAQNQRIRVLEQKTGHTPCKKYELILCYELYFNTFSYHCKIHFLSSSPVQTSKHDP